MSELQSKQRAEQWAKLSPDVRSERMRELAKKRHKLLSSRERKILSYIMIEGKRIRKEFFNLSIEKGTENYKKHLDSKLEEYKRLINLN